MPRAKKRGKGNQAVLGLNLPAVHHALQILEKEARYYSAMLPTKKLLVREAKRSLNGLLNKIQKSNVAHLAKDLATHKGAEVLSLLNFPTKRDVNRLSSRLSQLEKRMKNLKQRRGARA